MVDIAVRGHADGAAGARKQSQALGHNRAKSVAPDAHGMRAAYFHEVDTAVAHAVYAVDEFTRELGIAEGPKVHVVLSAVRGGSGCGSGESAGAPWWSMKSPTLCAFVWSCPIMRMPQRRRGPPR